MLTKQELLPVSQRPNGYSVEAQNNGTSATFVWDRGLGLWTMTKCERESAKADLVDPMERVIWHNGNGTKEQSDTREDVNIIPTLVQSVRQKEGRAAIWIDSDTKLDELVTLSPNQRATIPDYYQKMIQGGDALLITVGGITRKPAPKPKS